jgi:hypothetical protein
VGNAGKLLEEVGIDRSKLYVTNIVKIRPTKESGGSTQNRPPRAGDLEGASLSKLLRLSSRSARACTNGAVVATDSASANAD